jgi:hypothetical protein
MIEYRDLKLLKLRFCCSSFNLARIASTEHPQTPNFNLFILSKGEQLFAYNQKKCQSLRCVILKGKENESILGLCLL